VADVPKNLVIDQKICSAQLGVVAGGWSPLLPAHMSMVICYWCL